jgi:hypothetical protein
MRTPDYARLVKQFVDVNPITQYATNMILIALGEDAIDLLIDEYYAGVTDAEGGAILTIIAEIRDLDAMSALRNIFNFEDSRLILKRTAASGLLQNADNLSQYELEEVTLYLSPQNDDTYHGTSDVFSKKGLSIVVSHN